MGALIAILVIVGGWEALKDGYRHMRDSSRKPKPGTGGRRYSGNSRGGGSRSSSARHDKTGYWASEVGHGFPHFRHGFARGWNRHQQIRDDLYRDRQKARAEHLENRTGVVADVQEYRKRQRAAQDKIAETSAPQTETEDSQDQETPLPSEQGRRRHSQRLAWPESGMAAVTPITGNNPETSRPPADSSGEPSDPPPGGSPDASGGSDSTPGNTPDSSSGSNGKGSDDTESSPSQEGSPPVATTETTYSQDIEEANAIVSEAEQHLADLKARNWQDRMEALAGAGLDSDTLSRAADMNDSINDQIKAAEKTTENATAFRDGLVKTHGAGHEYHSSTEGGGAEKSYLADQ